jgi:uncharacterized protein YbjT (DUF2867 family)
MSHTQGRKIAIVGGTGTIGTPTLSALLAAQIHTITAISRTDSNATFASNVTVKKGDYASHSFLVSALTSNEVLIMQLGIFSNHQQIPLIKAAAEAGVKYILPTEFGSDPYAPFAKTFPMLTGKVRYRELVESLGMSWVCVVNNPWFDWSLNRGMWGVDVPNKKASMYTGAEGKFNTTSLQQVGRGVAALLSLPDAQLEKYKNSPVYLSSFCVSQRETLDATIRVTDSKESEWEIATLDADEIIEGVRKAVKEGNRMAFIKEFYITHMQGGAGGNYQEKAARDMKVLGLKEESLDEVVKAAVQELTGGM